MSARRSRDELGADGSDDPGVAPAPAPTAFRAGAGTGAGDDVAPDVGLAAAGPAPEPDEAATMTAIALAESGGSTRGSGGDSHGSWQVDVGATSAPAPTAVHPVGADPGVGLDDLGAVEAATDAAPSQAGASDDGAGPWRSPDAGAVDVGGGADAVGDEAAFGAPVADTDVAPMFEASRADALDPPGTEGAVAEVDDEVLVAFAAGDGTAGSASLDGGDGSPDDDAAFDAFGPSDGLDAATWSDALDEPG